MDDMNETERLPIVQGIRLPYLDSEVISIEEPVTDSKEIANEVVNDCDTRGGLRLVKVAFVFISGFASFFLVRVKLQNYFNQDDHMGDMNHE